MLGRGIGRLMHMGGTHCSARRRPEIIGKHRLLIGAQRIDRTDMVGNIVVQQYPLALPFIIAEVGAVLRISRVRGELERESVVLGKSVAVRGDLGGRRHIKKKKNSTK